MTLEALLNSGRAVFTGEAVTTWLEHHLCRRLQADGTVHALLLILMTEPCCISNIYTFNYINTMHSD